MLRTFGFPETADTEHSRWGAGVNDLTDALCNTYMKLKRKIAHIYFRDTVTVSKPKLFVWPVSSQLKYYSAGVINRNKSVN